MLPVELKDKELIILFKYRAAASGCGLFSILALKTNFYFFRRNCK